MALLGGFGDLNVDRSGGKGGSAENGGRKPSTALTIPPAELLKMRAPELKKKLKEVGVDLAKYPWAVEKKVRTPHAVLIGSLCSFSPLTLPPPSHGPMETWRLND